MAAPTTQQEIPTQYKAGDMVWFVTAHNRMDCYGMVLSQEPDMPNGQYEPNAAFKVLWRDGTIETKAYFDLVPMGDQAYLHVPAQTLEAFSNALTVITTFEEATNE